jgi:dipeptidyl aminopeptidase/acylaminoacyl peptidase
VPVAELEQLAHAWDALAAALKTKGLEFNIAMLPELPHEHAHPQHGENVKQ